MHPTLLHVLACPACSQEQTLQATEEVTQGKYIPTGRLVFTECESEYSIR